MLPRIFVRPCIYGSDELHGGVETALTPRRPGIWDPVDFDNASVELLHPPSELGIRMREAHLDGGLQQLLTSSNVPYPTWHPLDTYLNGENYIMRVRHLKKIRVNKNKC